MYTKKSIGLKSDFYARFGEAPGELCFERIGVPCVVMDSGKSALAFALGCGVRAYGRQCGDIIKILNDRASVCDVSRAKDGRGAQILYSEDAPGLPCSDDAAAFAAAKLLCRMGIAAVSGALSGAAAVCDRYGSGGRCAYAAENGVESLPLPLSDFNVLLIRTRRRGTRAVPRSAARRWCAEEEERTAAAAEGLRRRRLDVFFDMLNESERSREYLLEPPDTVLAAARAAMNAGGARAARICRLGVVCFVEKGSADSAIRAIAGDYERQTGFSAAVLTVK